MTEQLTHVEAEITQDSQSAHNKIKEQTDAMDNHEISCRLRQLVF